MLPNARRRNAGLLIAVAMLALAVGIGFAARSASLTTSSNSTAQAVQPHQVNMPGAAAPNVSSARTANAPGVTGPTVIHEVKHDTSAPLRDIPNAPLAPRKESANENDSIRSANSNTPAQHVVDPVLQSKFGPFAMPTPSLTFEGVNFTTGGTGWPPDTNGEVGPNNYVQTVNGSIQVWDKSGTSLLGPVHTNTIWAGFGGVCQTTNSGDPILQYDQLADRWLVSQFAFPPAGTHECIAISTTGDPTGSWHRYDFVTSPTNIEDYPHFGVWPDGYYMIVNEFDGTSQDFIGAGNFVFDRANMLVGNAATAQYFHKDPPYGGMLPTDLDGPTPPPVGEPNFFIEVDDDAYGPPFITDTMSIFKFHVDWATPTNSTFTGPTELTVASLDLFMCDFARNCIPQQGTTAKLDAITDRLMYRLAYRNFGDHESLVVNQTVDANSADHAGIRWYEVRSPNTTPVIYQQSTYAPDANHRWMGSAAMDKDGNMAIGFSESSSTMYPSIMYAGRLATDPLGQLAQGEGTLFAGTGAQTAGGGSRWGDYSALSVDPTDDCTFWYTNEYYVTVGTTWHTRIGSFKFPQCGQATPTPTTQPTSTNTPQPTVTNTPGPGTPTVTPCAITFTDVSPSDYFYVPVQYLYCHGAISGYGDNTFRPNNSTTRGQVSKIVVLAFGYTIYIPTTPTFTDVPADHPFYQYIETAVYQGIISGYANHTFLPGNNVTRGQLCKIVVLAAGWTLSNPTTPTFDDVPVDHPFYTYIETAYAHGIISGYGNLFLPGNSATRGQISKIVYNAVIAP